MLTKFLNLKQSEELMDFIDDIENFKSDEQRNFENDLILGKKRTEQEIKSLRINSPAWSVLDWLNRINRNSLDSVL